MKVDININVAFAYFLSIYGITWYQNQSLCFLVKQIFDLLPLTTEASNALDGDPVVALVGIVNGSESVEPWIQDVDGSESVETWIQVVDGQEDQTPLDYWHVLLLWLLVIFIVTYIGSLSQSYS